jgi:hypothetical protein
LNNSLIKTSSTSAWLSSILVTVLLGGCAKSVQVGGDFPQPLMEPYPLVAGIRYPASLTAFSHTEKTGNEPEITISIGATNRDMFRALFAGMFEEVVELADDPNAPIPANVDLVIEPTLVDLEVASPEKSGTDQYTVWLNYNLLLTRPDRTPLGDWKVTAYGQDDVGSMGMGAEDAINDATIIALRDTAATIATGFAQAPGIAALLAAKPAAGQPGPNVLKPADD